MAEIRHKPKVIKAWRKASGLTQMQLASLAGLTRITIVRVESGKRPVGMEVIYAITTALDRPLASALVESSR